MLAYTQVIAGSSTNVTTPTTPQINQGNDQLTPYNSAINNGYYRQMSQGIFNLSAEVENVIVAAGLTPDASLDQLLEAINILKVPSSATISTKGIVLLPSQITIANNASDTNNDIDFSAGVFQFSDGSGQAVAAALTKRLNAAWAAGNNQGGLDTGSKANSTWYHCYAIYNPTTLASDFLFSKGATTPTALPGGYTKFKRVGSIKTNGSGNIIGFLQNGSYFFFKLPILEFSGSSTGTATLATLSTPLGIKTISILSATLSDLVGSARALRIFSPDATDGSVDTANFNGVSIALSGTTTDVTTGSGNIFVQTNTSSQVYHKSFVSVSASIVILTQGWIDNGIL